MEARAGRMWAAWRKAASAAFVALFCLLVLSGIPGGRLPRWSAPTELTAPVLAPEDLERDASLVVTVRSGATHEPVAGAVVRAFAIIDGRAFLAATGTVTDDDGHATLRALPRGEHWVVVDAAGFARGSSHLLLTPDARSLDIELGAEHHVEVLVTDERGNPVVGAELEITGTDPLPFGGRTGDDGAAIVGRLTSAPWRVTARAPGYEEVGHRGVKEGEKLVITLRRLGALVVKVVGWDDSFVEGAHVHISGPSLWPARVTDTDKTGAAKISGLGSGSYALRAVFGQDCSPIELGVMLERGESKTVTLHLAPCRMIIARVTDGEGAAAPGVLGARVSLAEGGLSPFPMEALTGKDGRAKLGPIALGSASIAARADGFVPRGAVPVPEPTPKEIVIPLVRAGVLVGRVTDARGFPVDGATIEIIGTDFYGAPIAEDPRRTSFREAHFDATLAGPTKMITAGELGVVPGPVPPIPRGFSVGTATSTRPAPADVTRPADEPWVTRNDGTFRAAPASPGRIRALVRHPAYVEALSDTVTLTAGGEASVLVVMFAGGHLEGRVVDSGGRAVDNVQVAIAATRGTLERSTRVATDGTFVFSAVPDSIIVSVSFYEDPTQILTRLHVDIPEGKRKEITITLPESRPPLPALVRDDRAYPIENAQLTAHSLDPQIPFRSTVFTNARGEAQIPNAKGLPLKLEVTASSHAPKLAHVEATSSSVSVTLGPAESATGEVRSTRSDPIADAEVVLYTEMGARHARTSAEGVFRFEGLAPGAARVRVRATGFAPKATEVKIPDAHGDRPYAIARIELAGEGVVEGQVTDGRGDPIQGARVAMDHVPTYLAAGGTPPGVAVTDARGSFTLRELPEGDITLEAYAPDLGRVRVPGVRVSGGRTTIDVRIRLEKEVDAKTSDPGSSGGVAITLGETSAPREVVVVAVAEGSEAERAGLAPNDVLLEVDGARAQSIEQARKKLGGPIGDDVVVKVRRGERVETVRVAREQVRR